MRYEREIEEKRERKTLERESIVTKKRKKRK